MHVTPTPRLCKPFPVRALAVFTDIFFFSQPQPGPTGWAREGVQGQLPCSVFVTSVVDNRLSVLSGNVVSRSQGGPWGHDLLVSLLRAPGVPRLIAARATQPHRGLCLLSEVGFVCISLLFSAQVGSNPNPGAANVRREASCQTQPPMCMFSEISIIDQGKNNSVTPCHRFLSKPDNTECPAPLSCSVRG